MRTVKLFLSVAFGFMLAAGVSNAQNGGADFYRVKSALLANRRSFDFRLTSSYQGYDQPFLVFLNELDTLTFRGKSNLGDLTWSLRYAWNNNWEIDISGITYLDQISGTYRYGAGDSRIGISYASPNIAEAELNWAVELYTTFPLGFDEGNRLIRAFGSEKASFGSTIFVDFNMRNWAAKINGGYYHAKGRVQNIANPQETLWYNTLNGIYGISPEGKLTQSSQFYVGFGLSRNLFFNTKVFGEYYSQNILAKSGEGKSLGNAAAGLTFIQRPRLNVKFGMDFPLGTRRPGAGFFMDIRMNEIVGRRPPILREPLISPEALPPIQAGGKPFIRREGVLYSLPRSPIKDTVFIIDGSPSMLGRGIGADLRGEEVLNGIIEFVQILIDSIPDTTSNIALITYNNEISTLSWQNIDASKKEEIKNSVRDIPDEMRVKADDLDAMTQPWREMLVESIEEGYRQLRTFKRSDYNQQHLQRIVIFSDGLDESTMSNELAPGFEAIRRRYQLSRDDFRFFYYIHTNLSAEGARINDNIITFSEREDGKVKRSTDINDVGDELIAELNYNEAEAGETLKYLKLISKMAVLEFNTRGLGNIRDPLVDAFRSVFDYNNFFVLSPQVDVRAIMESEGIRQNQKVVTEDMVKVGKRLGVDYVVYGEVVKYKIERGRGIHIPYLIGLPKTIMEIEVAIILVNVAEGTVAFVDNVEASSSKGEGIMFFPTGRENKLNQLSGVDLAGLQKRLMLNWSRELRESMFQDIIILVN